MSLGRPVVDGAGQPRRRLSWTMVSFAADRSIQERDAPNAELDSGVRPTGRGLGHHSQGNGRLEGPPELAAADPEEVVELVGPGGGVRGGIARHQDLVDVGGGGLGSSTIQDGPVAPRRSTAVVVERVGQPALSSADVPDQRDVNGDPMRSSQQSVARSHRRSTALHSTPTCNPIPIRRLYAPVRLNFDALAPSAVVPPGSVGSQQVPPTTHGSGAGHSINHDHPRCQLQV
jgi:hypothetical protein